MKKATLILSFLIGISCLYSQTIPDHFIDLEGKKTLIHKGKPGERHSKGDAMFHGDWGLSAQALYYLTENGKVGKISQTKVKEAYLGGDHYIQKPMKGNGGAKRLHLVIATTSTHMITEYSFSGKHFVNLYDLSTDKCKTCFERMGWDSKDDLKLYNSSIKPKLSNCKELQDQIEKNLDNKDYAFKGISSFECK